MFIISNLIKKYRRKQLFESLGAHKESGFKHGFTDATISICGINKDNYTDFISNVDYRIGHPYNGAYTSILDNKLFLPMMLHEYKEYLPKYYFFIDDMGVLPLDDYPAPFKIRISFREVINLLNKEKKLAFKPAHESSGNGFFMLEANSGIYYINKKEIKLDALENTIKNLKEYIVTEYVLQHNYASNISKSSLNTLRFLCVWDYEKKEFFLARCYQRFGCNGSVVDNVGSGNGLCVFVDVETGKLKSEGNINYGDSGDVYAHDIVHPDNNILLTGLQIPNFQFVKSKILEIVNRHSYLRYVGLDVAITDNGFKIIELNSLSSLDAVQQRQGFLTDPRIRKVLKK